MPRYPQSILVSCEIPWDENEQMIEDVFRREVRDALEQGYRHIYVFGTAGEGYAVDTARFTRVLDVFWEETEERGEATFRPFNTVLEDMDIKELRQECQEVLVLLGARQYLPREETD